MLPQLPLRRSATECAGRPGLFLVRADSEEKNEFHRLKDSELRPRSVPGEAPAAGPCKTTGPPREGEGLRKMLVRMSVLNRVQHNDGDLGNEGDLSFGSVSATVVVNLVRSAGVEAS